jgi:hypothetical protein
VCGKLGKGIACVNRKSRDFLRFPDPLRNLWKANACTQQDSCSTISARASGKGAAIGRILWDPFEFFESTNARNAHQMGDFGKIILQKLRVWCRKPVSGPESPR